MICLLLFILTLSVLINQNSISTVSTINTKQVKFELYNVKGQKLYEFKQYNRKNDTRNIQLELGDQIKSRLKSGIYFIKMTTNDYTQSKKLVIIK